MCNNCDFCDMVTMRICVRVGTIVICTSYLETVLSLTPTALRYFLEGRG